MSHGSSEHLSLGRPEISADAHLELNELMNLSLTSLPNCVSSFFSLPRSNHALPPTDELSCSLGSLSISRGTLPPRDRSSSHASLSTIRSTLTPRDTLSQMDISLNRPNTSSTDTLPLTDTSFVSLGSASKLLEEDNTFSHVEHNSDVKKAHSSHAKNRDEFVINDFVSSVWSRNSGTLSGDLTSKQPRQPIIQTNNDPSKRILSYKDSQWIPRRAGAPLPKHYVSPGSFLQQSSIQTNKSVLTGDVDPSKRIVPPLIPKRAGTPYSKERVPPAPKRVKRELKQRSTATPAKRPLSKWSKEEDIRLQEGVEIYGIPNWVEIAKHVKTRNNKKCRQRWFMSVNPKIRVAKKGKWSVKEDNLLRQIVSRHGSRDGRTWELASKGMGYTRNIKQCRERWENFLDPSLRLGPWTAAEDACLLRLHGKFGNAWTKFASVLPGRSAERVRRRFMQLRKRTGSKYS